MYRLSNAVGISLNYSLIESEFQVIKLIKITFFQVENWFQLLEYDENDDSQLHFRQLSSYDK